MMCGVVGQLNNLIARKDLTQRGLSKKTTQKLTALERSEFVWCMKVHNCGLAGGGCMVKQIQHITQK